MQRFRELHRSETVVVRDFRCRPTHSGCSGEERATSVDFTVVRAGAFLRRLNGSEHLADPNHVTFFNRDEPYSVTHPIEGGDDCTVITVADDSICDVVEEFDPTVNDRPDAPFRFESGPLSSEAFALHHRILAYVRQANPDTLVVDESILTLATATVRAAFQVRGATKTRRRPGTTIAHRRIADDLRTVLNSRFRERITLAALARAVHSSAYHAARVFRMQMGSSVHQYLNRLRLRTALERIADSRDDLTAIALDHGFSSHSHFTDTFTHTFGTPPSAFRKSVTARALREMSTNLEARLAPAP